MTDPNAAEVVLPYSQVAELFQVISKGIRALGLYLPNNPMYQRAVDQVRGHFEPIWEATDELQVAVRETDLIWEGEVVYSTDQKSESLAWTMFKDGVRTLTLRPGVEDDEIVRFMQTIVTARNLPSEAADDLLTLLWEQDFERLTYTFTDVLADVTSPPEAEGGTPEARPEEVAQEVEEERERPTALSLDDFDSTLYFLDEQEIQRLQDEIGREYQQDLRENVLAILFDLLELEVDEAVRAEVLTIVEEFIPYLLAAGDYHSVAYVLGQSREVASRGRALTAEQRGRLEQLPALMSTPEAVAQLLQAVDSALVAPPAEELGHLFAEVYPEALATLLSWITRLENADVRETVAAAVERLARKHPAALVDALASQDPGTALNGVRLAARMRLGPAVQPLGELLGRPQTEVRLAVVEALTVIGTPGALQALVQAVDDATRDVRLAAVRVLGQRRFRNALGRIESAIDGKALRDADLTEKMAFFEAYGLIGGPQAVTNLEALLLSRSLFRKRHDPETRACAALALGKIGTPEALAALEEARSDKDVLVRNAVAQAFRGGADG